MVCFLLQIAPINTLNLMGYSRALPIFTDENAKLLILAQSCTYLNTHKLEIHKLKILDYFHFSSNSQKKIYYCIALTLISSFDIC